MRSKRDQEAARAGPHDRLLTIFYIAAIVAPSWEGCPLGLHLEFVKDQRLHEAAVISKASIFESKSRATFNASEFVYGARRLAIRSYDKWTPS